MNALFVDVANLYYCVGKRFQNRKLDYAKIIERATDLGPIHRQFAYGIQMTDEAGPFISCLRRLGYDTKYKRYRLSDDNERKIIHKATWGVGISLDVVRIIDKVGTVIIGSSDLDLLDLVRYVRDKGVRCIILACGIPQELREACDFYIEITEDLLEVREEVPVA